FTSCKLLSLDIYIPSKDACSWDELDFLLSLRTYRAQSKILTNLIENTKGNLSEISLLSYTDDDSIFIERLIQAIYQNCPSLRYLRLSIFNENITEFENLLINCQFLN